MHTYILVCAYIHTYIHTYTLTCIHTYIHAYIHTYRTLINTNIYTHTYIHTYIQFIHTYTHTYIHSLHEFWRAVPAGHDVFGHGLIDVVFQRFTLALRPSPVYVCMYVWRNMYVCMYCMYVCAVLLAVVGRTAGLVEFGHGSSAGDREGPAAGGN